MVDGETLPDEGEVRRMDSAVHHRHSIRLPGYDYSQAGAYYVTLVSYRRECLFGDLVNHEFTLNVFGRVIRYAWLDLPCHYPNVRLDAFCIMPNHVHGFIILNEEIPGVHHPLSEIIRGFKTLSAKRINVLRKMQGMPVWQRNYYEHIIRNEADYNRISQYILTNPDNWGDDEENPDKPR